MFNLFINHYHERNPIRQKEIDFCLTQNILNTKINTIIFNSQDRLNYDFYFYKANKITSPNDINIVVNSDIFLAETIVLAENIKSDECYALSRWDLKPNGTSVFFNRQDSQDAWIFRGQMNPNLKADFPLGLCGSDNRLAYELNNVGYKMSNPSLSIRVFHAHSSNIRNYVMNDKRFVVPGPYLQIIPGSIGETGKTKKC
jgi:hypothetical protein